MHDCHHHSRCSSVTIWSKSWFDPPGLQILCSMTIQCRCINWFKLGSACIGLHETPSWIGKPECRFVEQLILNKLLGNVTCGLLVRHEESSGKGMKYNWRNSILAGLAGAPHVGTKKV